MRLSEVTGNDITIAGRDYYRQEVAATLPRIEVEIRIRAEPLARLFHDHEVVEAWLRRRRAHLEKTLTPEPPASSDGKPNFVRPLLYAADFTGERAEFRKRLDDHLDACRDRLVDNVLEWIIDSRVNAVSFPVENPTEDPIVGLRVMANFAVGDAHVLADSPDAQPMPPAPQWPDHFTMMRGFDAAELASSMSWLPARPARAGLPRIEITNGFAQVNYVIGDLLAFETIPTPPIFIIPQVDFEVEELEITVTARAKNRKGVKTQIFTVPIREEGVVMERVISPTY